MICSELDDLLIDLNLKVSDSGRLLGLLWMGVIGMEIFLQR